MTNLLIKSDVLETVIFVVLIAAVFLICYGVGYFLKKKKKAKKNVQLDPEKVAKFEQQIKELFRNEIALKIEGKAEYKQGGTRFGGVPDVSEDFKWPYFNTAVWGDKEVKPRPLNFLAQFNLQELSALDKDNLLPKKGLLSFFHVTEADCWGSKPEDMSCVRVFWFEDISVLKQAEVPEEFQDGKLFPMLNIAMGSKTSFIDYEDFTEMLSVNYGDFEEFDKACENLGYVCEDNSSKLLGWAEVIQSNITNELELIHRGYPFAKGGYSNVSDEVLKEVSKTSPNDWLLLFQLDTVWHEDFELMYGDCGRLYVYIRKEDLAARKFDKVYFTWQCG